MKKFLTFMFCFLSFSSFSADLKDKDIQTLETFYKYTAIENNKFLDSRSPETYFYSYEPNEDIDFNNFKILFHHNYYYYYLENKLSFRLSGAFFFINFMEKINNLTPIEKYYEDNIFLASYCSDNYIYKLKIIIEGEKNTKELEPTNENLDKKIIDAGYVTVILAYKKRESKKI